MIRKRYQVTMLHKSHRTTQSSRLGKEKGQ